MTDGPLTDEQQTIVTDDAEQFVTACPGAGKTRVVAERFVRVVNNLPSGRGAAVLSFTRAAAEEIGGRCRKQLGRNPGFPHFIGTCDSFINRYLVMPFQIPGMVRKPDVLDSYARLEIAARPPGGQFAAGLTLDELVFGADGSTTLDPRRADARIRKIIEANPSPWLNAGKHRLRGVLKAGYLNPDAARAIAMKRIRDDGFTSSIGPILAARFAEITVDEAQDSSVEEIELFTWLRRVGVRLTFVGDPDQAIFEFRDARPELLASAFHDLQPRQLTSNFRSTDNICRAAASVTPGRNPATAAGEHSAENLPILLIGHDDPHAHVAQFHNYADAVRVPDANRVILAHRRSDVAKLTSRAAFQFSASSAQAEKLISAARLFRASPDSRDRQRAIDVAEHFLLDLAGAEESGIPARRCEKAGIDTRRIRREAHALLLKLPLPEQGLSPSQWQAAALAYLRLLTGCQLGAKDLRVLSADAWTRVQETPASVRPTVGMTIHQAKGREFDAVLLFLPFHARHTPLLLDQWTKEEASEALRVLYVAMTRARRFLAVGVPKAILDRIADLLTRSGATLNVIQP